MKPFFKGKNFVMLPTRCLLSLALGTSRLIAAIKEVREDLEVNLCVLVMEINFATFFFCNCLWLKTRIVPIFVLRILFFFSSFGTCKKHNRHATFTCSEKKTGDKLPGRTFCALQVDSSRGSAKRRYFGKNHLLTACFLSFL